MLKILWISQRTFQNAIISIFIIHASISNSAQAQINVVRDLGCKLDDYSFDNGPILNAAFARVGKASLGQFNEEFYLPGGAIVFKTPLVLPKKTGISIRGNGITIALPEGAYHNLAGGPATRLVYVGPADKPAISYYGMGLKLDGVTIQRGKYPTPPSPPQRDGSIALAIAGDESPGTGKIVAPQLSIFQFDTAILASARPNNTHADQNQFGFLWVQNCWTVFRSDNVQSVGNQFQLLMVGGSCDTVFDIRRGGDLVIDQLVLNNAALVLKTDRVDVNDCSYEIRTMKVDNFSAGWRLLEMTRPAPIRFHAAGHIGRRATPAPDAVKLQGDPQNQDVRIDFWWDGKRWPAEQPH
jgi:hypothetical protein